MYLTLMMALFAGGCITSSVNYDGKPEDSYHNYLNDEDDLPRKLIYQAFIGLVVQHPDTTNQRLVVIARENGGYILNLGNKKSVIRVQTEKLQEALTALTRLGKVKYRNVTGEDVTDQFTDYKIRLDNAYKTRKRYLELLEMARTVEETLRVEKELERLNMEIDTLEGKLNKLEHLSSYSTITVNMTEKAKLGILGYVGAGLFKAVKWLIVRN